MTQNQGRREFLGKVVVGGGVAATVGVGATLAPAGRLGAWWRLARVRLSHAPWSSTISST